MTPGKASNNNIEITADSYTIDNTTTPVNDTYSFVYGGGTNAVDSFGNSLTISSGTIDAIIGGMAARGGNVHSNHIVINGGTITGVIGGLAVWQSGWNVGDVHHNTVKITGGTVNYVSGGEIAYLEGADASGVLSNAYNNTVEVSGGTVNSGIVGGSALGGNATENTIDISGGTVSGNVIGGQTQSGEASGNSINISGNPDVSGATFYGGLIGNTPSATDNTLNLNSWGITAQNIYGFDTLNFNLGDVGTGAAFTLTNGATDLSGLKSFTVNSRGDSNIGTGSTLTIMQNDNGISLGGKTLTDAAADDSNIFYSGKMTRGVTFDYDLGLSLSADGKSISGTVGGHDEPNEETETADKAQIANIMTINNGTDNLITSIGDYLNNNITEDDDGYFSSSNERKVDEPTGDEQEVDDENSGDKAQKAEEVREVHGFEIFASAGYGHLRTGTGNGGKVKTETSNFDLGLARTYEGARNRWTVAPVVEHGKGNYDAILSNGVTGYGNTKYTAGGLIARNVNSSGYYLEMSARFGRSKNNFASDDFKDSSGNLIRATYHTSAPVFAGHLRLGQAKLLNRSNLLDIYGIYSYTRQGGSDTTLSTGDPYKFSSINSSRFRLGYRLTTRTSKISRIYTGLAYQYEHTSDADTRAIDAEGIAWNLPSKGSKGSSGMFEFGWMIKPRKDNPWLLDINTTAWFGHQKGATAMAKIKKSF